MSVKSNSGSGQKFLGRNRAPRVQIEYDVELYGAEHRVQLPFVMGVLADLAGHNTESQPELGERKFMEIDVDNFDDRMKSIAPKLNMQVPNSLKGDGVDVDEEHRLYATDYDALTSGLEPAGIEALRGGRLTPCLRSSRTNRCEIRVNRAPHGAARSRPLVAPGATRATEPPGWSSGR